MFRLNYVHFYKFSFLVMFEDPQNELICNYLKTHIDWTHAQGNKLFTYGQSAPSIP